MGSAREPPLGPAAMTLKRRRSISPQSNSSSSHHSSGPRKNAGTNGLASRDDPAAKTESFMIRLSEVLDSTVRTAFAKGVLDRKDSKYNLSKDQHAAFPALEKAQREEQSAAQKKFDSVDSVRRAASQLLMESVSNLFEAGPVQTVRQSDPEIATLREEVATLKRQRSQHEDVARDLKEFRSSQKWLESDMKAAQRSLHDLANDMLRLQGDYKSHRDDYDRFKKLYGNKTKTLQVKVETLERIQPSANQVSSDFSSRMPVELVSSIEGRLDDLESSLERWTENQETSTAKSSGAHSGSESVVSEIQHDMSTAKTQFASFGTFKSQTEPMLAEMDARITRVSQSQVESAQGQQDFANGVIESVGLEFDRLSHAIGDLSARLDGTKQGCEEQHRAQTARLLENRASITSVSDELKTARAEVMSQCESAASRVDGVVARQDSTGRIFQRLHQQVFHGQPVPSAFQQSAAAPSPSQPPPQQASTSALTQASYPQTAMMPSPQQQPQTASGPSMPQTGVYPDIQHFLSHHYGPPGVVFQKVRNMDAAMQRSQESLLSDCRTIQQTFDAFRRDVDETTNGFKRQVDALRDQVDHSSGNGLQADREKLARLQLDVQKLEDLKVKIMAAVDKVSRANDAADTMGDNVDRLDGIGKDHETRLKEQETRLKELASKIDDLIASVKTIDANNVQWDETLKTIHADIRQNMATECFLIWTELNEVRERLSLPELDFPAMRRRARGMEVQQEKKSDNGSDGSSETVDLSGEQ